MTRTLFVFTCLVAALSTFAAVLIRLELARTGINPLFQTDAGVVNLDAFRAVSMAHLLFGYLTVALMGTTMIAAARERGGDWAGGFMWIGVATCIAMTVIGALIMMPLPDGDLAWAPIGRTAWGAIAPFIAPRPITDLAHLTVFGMIPAAALVLIGAYAMLSAETGQRWSMILGVMVTVATSLLAAQILAVRDPITAQSVYVLSVLPFLAIACVRLTDEASGWLVVLTLGVFALIAAQITASVWNVTLMRGSMAHAASQYVLPLGLVWFALPAFLLFRFNGRGQTERGETVIWLMAPLVAVGVALWAVPMFMTGIDGQPAGFAEYLEVFAPLNLAATIGLGVFIALYLALITWVYRTGATGRA